MKPEVSEDRNKLHGLLIFQMLLICVMHLQGITYVLVDLVVTESKLGNKEKLKLGVYISYLITPLLNALCIFHKGIVFSIEF